MHPFLDTAKTDKHLTLGWREYARKPWARVVAALIILAGIALVTGGNSGEQKNEAFERDFLKVVYATRASLLEFNEVDQRQLRGETKSGEYERAWRKLEKQLDQLRIEEEELDPPSDREANLEAHLKGVRNVIEAAQTVIAVFEDGTSVDKLPEARKMYEEGLVSIRNAESVWIRGEEI